MGVAVAVVRAAGQCAGTLGMVGFQTKGSTRQVSIFRTIRVGEGRVRRLGGTTATFINSPKLLDGEIA